MSCSPHAKRAILGLHVHTPRDWFAASQKGTRTAYGPYGLASEHSHLTSPRSEALWQRPEQMSPRAEPLTQAPTCLERYVADEGESRFSGVVSWLLCVHVADLECMSSVLSWGRGLVG